MAVECFLLVGLRNVPYCLQSCTIYYVVLILVRFPTAPIQWWNDVVGLFSKKLYLVFSTRPIWRPWSVLGSGGDVLAVATQENLPAS